MTDPARRLTPVVRVAPAKINLTLAVLGRRSDGFHDLHSVVVPLALADTVSVAIQPSGPDSLHVRGADCGPAEENIVLSAIAAARRAAAPRAAGPAALPPLAARLEKRIPVAAGLGGGSSDAAAAIDAALDAWGVALPPAERSAVAASVGSDVPLFLAGGPVLLEGRGERVTPLPGPTGQPPGVLLVTPGFDVPTPDVFGAFAAASSSGAGSGSTRLSSQHLADELRKGMTGHDLVVRAGVLASANDLAPITAALRPELVPLKRSLMRRLGRPVGQSGSGPTLWSLYPSLADASLAATELREAVGSGALVVPGDRSPSIHATTFAAEDSPR